MIQIKRFACENLTIGCVTDESNPRFSFYVESDIPGNSLHEAELTVNGWTTKINSQLSEHYRGPKLAPFTQYTAVLSAADDRGGKDEAILTFGTGRMNTPWQAKWISDPSYTFSDKGISPVPMTFRKLVHTAKPIAKARIYATAMGIYELELNGCKGRVPQRWYRRYLPTARSSTVQAVKSKHRRRYPLLHHKCLPPC